VGTSRLHRAGRGFDSRRLHLHAGEPPGSPAPPPRVRRSPDKTLRVWGRSTSSARVHPRRAPGSWVAPRKARSRAREGEGSSPSGSTSCLRSVNGKHAPFVRPRCGFNSCRRLSCARGSRDRALPCDGRGCWFESSRAFHADVAQTAEHRVASPERPVRSGSSALTGPWCNGSTTSSNLVGPGSNPGGPARRGPKRIGYLGTARSHCDHRAVQVRARPQHTTATTRRCCGPERHRFSTSDRQVAGSNPARGVVSR
jgi:hypothetical protein